jgi:hypothetical protein
VWKQLPEVIRRIVLTQRGVEESHPRSPEMVTEYIYDILGPDGKPTSTCLRFSHDPGPLPAEGDVITLWGYKVLAAEVIEEVVPRTGEDGELTDQTMVWRHITVKVKGDKA